MTNIIEHEGVKYRTVNREAEVGDLVYVVSCDESPELNNMVGKCTVDDEFDDGSISIGLPTTEYGAYGFLDAGSDVYYVLIPEPSIETPVEASPTVIELLANISRRLYEAEQTLKTQAYEINELYKANAEGAVADRD